MRERSSPLVRKIAKEHHVDISQIRGTGIALSYNIGVPIFGGLSPAIGTWLIYATGNKLSPSFYLMLTALLSLAALLAIRQRYRLQ